MAHLRTRTALVLSVAFVAVMAAGVAVSIAAREPKPTYVNNEKGPTPAAAPVSKGLDPAQETVYITRTGKKYHRKDCRWAKDGMPTTLVVAAEKYLPCSVCLPPRLSDAKAQADVRPALPPAQPEAPPTAATEHKAIPPVQVTETPPPAVVEAPIVDSPQPTETAKPVERSEDPPLVVEEHHEPFVPPVPIKATANTSERSEKRPVERTAAPPRSTTVVKTHQSQPSNCPPSSYSRGWFRRR